MLVEFYCAKIKTSFKTDVQNFAAAGSGKITYHKDANMVELYFQKEKEKIYFDEKPSFFEIYHPVDCFY